ncbi:hypothetical protein RUND412_002887 [Rhizina undulata]
MNSSQAKKDATGNSGLELPYLSPTGYEYYLMIPFSSGNSPELRSQCRYRKHLVVLDPSLQLGANSTTMDNLDEHQVLAIENLLKERNVRTEIEGEWVLSGLRTTVRSEKFELIIKFRGYRDFVVPKGVDVVTEAVEECRNDALAEVSAETAITAAEGAEAEIAANDIQRLGSFSIDSEFESTVGRRSPTPTSDIGSGAATPVPAVIRTEKEIQIGELDILEEVACNCLESMKGRIPSVTTLSILKGVLEARKILVGSEDLQTWKTMENLGYWYAKHGLHNHGIALLEEAVASLQRVLGEKDERTLTAMYQLACAKKLSRSYETAWPIFAKVLECRLEALGKSHEGTLDTLKRIEEIFFLYCNGHPGETDRTPFLESLLKFEIEIRGENHLATRAVLDYLVFAEHRRDRKDGTQRATKALESLLYRLIPVLDVHRVRLEFFLKDLGSNYHTLYTCNKSVFT